jgi:preprotein translocase subunit SecE
MRKDCGKAMEDKPKFTQRTKSFFKEVQIEMKKVTWPTRGELYGSTAVVIACTILLSVAMGLFDGLLGRVTEFLLNL